MKKIMYKYINRLLLICMAATLILLSACEREDSVLPPVITSVRNYAPSPNDTIITTLNTGQWVVIHGKNLSQVSQVYFGSVSATLNNTFFTDASIVVQIPSIPFELVPAEAWNVITVVNAGGTARYEIEIVGVPLITRVRNDEGETIDMVFPEQQINIIGFNLKDATSIMFQGIEADLSSVVYTDSSAIVQLPADLSGGDATLVNMISYANRVGTGAFPIRIVGPPVITRVSYEIPKEGDVVYLYGHNFLSVQSISFAGTTISSFEESEDGNSVKFIAPNLTGSGPVKIETPAGTFTTAYKVNDIAYINAGGIGIIANLEWSDYFGWAWGHGDVNLFSSDPNSGWPSFNADYGVGTGQYLIFKSNPLNAGQTGYLAGWGGNQIILNDAGGQWVPTENLNDPSDRWALKFEINVKKPWNGGTLCIRTQEASNYIALYEPWKVGNSSAAFTTGGWQTVTIPLSSFRLDDGKGNPVPKVSDLLNNSGKTFMRVYLHNFGNSTTTNFEAAFDNFRVVRR